MSTNFRPVLTQCVDNLMFTHFFLCNRCNLLFHRNTRIVSHQNKNPAGEAADSTHPDVVSVDVAVWPRLFLWAPQDHPALRV